MLAVSAARIRKTDMRTAKKLCLILSGLILALSVTGCSFRETSESTTNANGTTNEKPAVELSGKVTVDGSSTVFPISQAMGEEFKNLHKQVDVNVGESGTGPGLKHFAEGKCDIADASRPIKPSEIDACKAVGIEWIELKVAIDGLSVVVNPQNDWCQAITVAQLKALWS